MRDFDNYNDALSHHAENGGWLLQTGDHHFTVTDDEGLVKDLRGEDFVHHCESCGSWDETQTGLIQAQHLNDKGQDHVKNELKELGLDWDADATMTEIETRMHNLDELLCPFNDSFYYEIKGSFNEIEITSEMVEFARVTE